MILNRKIFSVLLITLALCGVQVVQASPLHDHTGHLSGCSLCHFNGASAIRQDSDVHIWVTGTVTEIFIGTVLAPVAGHYPAFRGRAPPLHFS